MFKGLKGKRVLITGGSEGIGLASALRFAEEGAKVVISARREEPLNKAVAMHEAISGIVADVASPDDNSRLVAETVKELGGIDVLFNNAGIATTAPLAELKLEEYDRVFGINVRGLLDVTQQALPHIVEAKGVIINNASISGLKPGPGATIYGASKAAVLAFTTSWARELAPKGVRVLSVSPGSVTTPIWFKVPADEQWRKEQMDRIAEMNPMKRFGEADEIAAVVALIASDEAPFMNGTDIRIDGGQIT